MDTPRTSNRLPRKRRRGGQPGNQNARKHGRSSRFQPADRVAYLRKVLRRYGIRGTTTVGGIPFGAYAAESNTQLMLVLGWIQLSAQVAELQARLADTQAQLADARARLNRR